MNTISSWLDSLQQSRILQGYRQHQTLWLSILLMMFLASSWLGNVMLIESGSQYYNQAYDLFFQYFRYLIYVLMSVTILMQALLMQYKPIPLAIYVVLLAVVFFFSRSSEFLIWMLLIGAMAPMRFSHALRWYVLIQGLVLLCVPLLCAFDVFPNVLLDSTRARYALGFTWVTSAPILFVFFSASWLYRNRRNLNWSGLGGLLLIGVLFNLLTDTRMAFVMEVILVVLALIYWKQRSWLKPMKSLNAAQISALVPIVLTIIAVVLAIVYSDNNAFLAKINGMLSGRLANSAMAWNKYGLSLFGQNIVWHGQGVTFDPSDTYLFVDCSYLNILLNYGIVFLLFVLAWCVQLVWTAWKHHNGFLMCLILLLFLFSFMEVRLINPLYNPLVLLAGQWLIGNVNGKEICHDLVK